MTTIIMLTEAAERRCCIYHVHFIILPIENVIYIYIMLYMSYIKMFLSVKILRGGGGGWRFIVLFLFGFSSIFSAPTVARPLRIYNSTAFLIFTRPVFPIFRDEKPLMSVIKNPPLAVFGT